MAIHSVARPQSHLRVQITWISRSNCADSPIFSLSPACDDPFVWRGQPLRAEGDDPMRIEQLMTKLPKSCQSGDTLGEAAQLMWDHDCGCLPVTADDGSQRVIGMITDRDICMAALSHGEPLKGIRVGDAMATDVWACNPGDSPCEAEAIMREARVRRLPVVDEADQLLGLISLADIAREAERQHWRKRREITEAEVGEVLTMICQPRAASRPVREEWNASRDPRIDRLSAGIRAVPMTTKEVRK
jgi:CBS domain-containing protein